MMKAKLECPATLRKINVGERDLYSARRLGGLLDTLEISLVRFEKVEEYRVLFEQYSARFGDLGTLVEDLKVLLLSEHMFGAEMTLRGEKTRSYPTVTTTSREVTPSLENESGEELYEVEFIFGAKVSENGQWEYLTKWLNYSATENTWEPESSFSRFAMWSVNEFWKRLGRKGVRERIRDFSAGTQFAVPAEELENSDHSFEMEPVTKKTKYPKLIVRGPALPEVHPDAANDVDDSGNEIGSTTEVEEELNVQVTYDDDEPQQSVRCSRGASRSNRQKDPKLSKRAAAELYPETTQPYLTVSGSLLHTKAKLYQDNGYVLVQPGDPERTFKEFSMNTRPNTQRGGDNPLLNEYSREEDLNTSLLDLNDGGKDGVRGGVSRSRPESPMMMETVPTDEVEEADYPPMDVGDAAEDADDEADVEAEAIEDMDFQEARQANSNERLDPNEASMIAADPTQDPEQEAHDAFNSFVRYPEDDPPIDTSNSGSMVQEDTNNLNPLEVAGLNGTKNAPIGPHYQYFPFHPRGGDDSFEDIGPLLYPETEQLESGDEADAERRSQRKRASVHQLTDEIVHGCCTT
ncbi:hypothetical protein AAF712_007273 [Marasmius tenuissimus]|uniref:Chromo domain-containing protein n=1 Tax=Marasmius tenuissimus TaxID=585030 RepID=A0ABR2ZWS8_9AGAR